MTDDARGGTLAGTGQLVRFLVRRDRVRIPVWIGSLTLLVLSSAASIKGLYPTQSELERSVGPMLENAAVIAMNGPPYAIDTYGGQIVFQIGSFGYLVMALFGMFLVARHTRADEEEGRTELLRATAIGRNAPVAAALVVAAGAYAVLGALIALSMRSQDVPTSGSWIYGAAMAAFGLLFAAITAVTVQVTQHNRAALGIAGALLGMSYVVRGIGDTEGGGLSWASPMGWAQYAKPYAGDHLWPLLLVLGLTVVCVVGAFALLARRDLGGGLLAARPGPPRASPALGSPLGLAVRLQRATVVSWLLGLAGTGVAYGSVAQDVDDLIGDNDAFEDVIAQVSGVSLTDAFLTTSLLSLAVLAGGFAVSATLRLRSEETGGRAEPLLATAMSRARWAASHVLVALVGSTAITVAAAAGMGIANAIALHDLGEALPLTLDSLAFAPALWVVVAATFALVGLIPKATIAAWAVLTWFALLAFFGQLLGLPQLVLDLSPFQHVPPVPARDVELAPLLALTAVAAALLAAGFAGLRRRDVPA